MGGDICTYLCIYAYYTYKLVEKPTKAGFSALTPDNSLSNTSVPTSVYFNAIANDHEPCATEARLAHAHDVM